MLQQQHTETRCKRQVKKGINDNNNNNMCLERMIKTAFCWAGSKSRGSDVLLPQVSPQLHLLPASISAPRNRAGASRLGLTSNGSPGAQLRGHLLSQVLELQASTCGKFSVPFSRRRISEMRGKSTENGASVA